LAGDGAGGLTLWQRFRRAEERNTHEKKASKSSARHERNAYFLDLPWSQSNRSRIDCRSFM
jgi:hypothetical protein